jgi:gliding motility-associated-like protein
MYRLRLVFVFVMFSCLILSGQSPYTQRLSPEIIASTNDICPDDEVQLIFSYIEPDNTSLLLNGIDELVNITPSPNFDFGANGDFSIEFYVKTTDLGEQTIIAKGAFGLPGYVIGLESGEVRIIVTDGVNPAVVVNGFSNLADGAWHHVAVVFDRDDKVTIYADGFFDNDGNILGLGSFDNADLLRIGAVGIAGMIDLHFNGYIDEVRIWNSALSVAEINARRFTHLNPASFPNLVGSWDMNDVTGPVLIDCSQSAASGVMIGSASLSLDAPSLTFPFQAQWDFGATGLIQFVAPTDTTEYFCTVGYCKYASIDSITINVLECEDDEDADQITSVWIPNAFTPNGDSKNDRFEVQGSFLTFYDIKIFNRIGNILYHSQNILSSWDGTFEGEQVKDDVYSYIITYRDIDGNEFKKYGTVLVTR